MASKWLKDRQSRAYFDLSRLLLDPRKLIRSSPASWPICRTPAHVARPIKLIETCPVLARRFNPSGGRRVMTPCS